MSASRKKAGKAATAATAATASSAASSAAAGGGDVTRVTMDPTLTRESVVKAAERDEARAFEYMYETPDRKLSSKELLTVCVALRQDFEAELRLARSTIQRELRAELGGAEPSRDAVRRRMPSEASVREKLIARSEAFRLLSRRNDHQRTFLTLTSYELTESAYQKIMELLKLREKMESGAITAAEAERVVMAVAQKDMSAAKVRAAMSTTKSSSKLAKLQAELDRIEASASLRI